MKLSENGYDQFRPFISKPTLCALRECAFFDGQVGTRCLLDQSMVRSMAIELRAQLVAAGLVSRSAIVIQAIAFDKTPITNWKVTWHQDVMFPFARPVTQNGFDMPSQKAGIDYARPPRMVLEELLAVRLHLDDCDESNGPLRVAPGSHRHGVFRSAEILDQVIQHGEDVCLVKEGTALLMKPLLLHASSPATAPKHRRVLHFVFHSGEPMAETWFRAV